MDEGPPPNEDDFEDVGDDEDEDMIDEEGPDLLEEAMIDAGLGIEDEGDDHADA